MSKDLNHKKNYSDDYEKRMIYTAITRAKKQSFVSFVANRMYRGDWVDSLASRFIDELPEENIKKNEIKDINNEDFFFNQDIEYNEGLRSPGYARLQKKLNEKIKKS